MVISRVVSATGDAAETAHRSIWVTEMEGRQRTPLVQVTIGNETVFLTPNEAEALAVRVGLAARRCLEPVGDFYQIERSSDPC